MAEKRKHTRKPRTRFTQEQLRMLRGVSQRTLCPDRATIQYVATETQLDKYVVQVWFKNQRAKIKRIDAEGRHFPASNQRARSEGDPYSPRGSLETPPSAPSTCSPLDLGSPLSVNGEHPKVAAASVLSPGPDAEPSDPLDVIDLQHLHGTPWVSSTQDLESFIKIYHISGDNDLESLDQYLFPLGSVPLGSHPLQE